MPIKVYLIYYYQAEIPTKSKDFTTFVADYVLK